MSNQPQSRPWFRLASIRSAAPPPAPAAPRPRPPPTIPSTFRNITSTPSERTPPPPTSAPAPRAPAAPPPPAPAPAPAPAPLAAAAPPPPASPVTAAQSVADRLSTSPTTRVAQPQTTSPNKIAAASRGVSPVNQNSSPRTIKPEVQSPSPLRNQKTATPSPSPLTLPPSQLRSRSEVEPRIPAAPETEPKTVLVQKSPEKPISWSTKNSEVQRERGSGHNGKQIPSKEFESNEKHFYRKILDPEDSAPRVITLAGENRGAYMKLIRSSKKHEPKILRSNGGTKTKSSGGESKGSNNEEGKEAGNKDNKSRKGKAVSSPFPMTAFMNSNVQGVNNSIMFNASCEHKDPGLHLSLTGDGLRFK